MHYSVACVSVAMVVVFFVAVLLPRNDTTLPPPHLPPATTKRRQRPRKATSNVTFCPMGTYHPLSQPTWDSSFSVPSCVANSTQGFSLAGYGEDAYALRTFFPDLWKGTFVELGALDGLIGSNTAFFEAQRGWTGVLVEANPLLFPKLCARRGCAHRVSAAICGSSGGGGGGNTSETGATEGRTLHFVQRLMPNEPDGGGAIGGIWEFMSPSYRHKWYRSGEADPSFRKLPIRCYSLTHLLLDLFHVTHVDFFSLDVEGAELSVLQTLDLARIQVDVFVVELDGHDPQKDAQVRQLLHASGFVVHGAGPRNTWFVRGGSPYTHCRNTYVEPTPYKRRHRK